jgi:hypothetical protein
MERREERHAEAAVCKRVKETVTSGRDKQIRPHQSGIYRERSSPEHCRDTRRKKGRERKGMSKAPVSPEVAVMDAEAETDYVEIGKHRAERPYS